MSAVDTPPPGLGPAMAVSRASSVDRRKAMIGTLVGYVAIAVVFSLVRGFYWPSILIFAFFAALTFVFLQRSALAAGDGWLKAAGGSWVQTAALTAVRVRSSTTATFVELEDVAGRRLNVRLDDLTRTPQLWAAFAAGLSRSLDHGLVVDARTGARLRATDAFIRAHL